MILPCSCLRGIPPFLAPGCTSGSVDPRGVASEGIAVLAAYQRRQKDHALGDDPDYVALNDQARIQSDIAIYFRDYDDLKSCGSRVADADAWKVIKRMSSGERLWYRVGAYMAQRIEASKGRVVLVDLVKQGPTKFIATYKSLGSPHT